MTNIANIHASCVLLGDAGKPFGAPLDVGILILGESGSGKSDLALRLIACGAQLVADDRTELFMANGALMGRAPVSLAGLMEVRGLGIVALPFAAQAHVVLAVTLVETGQMPRLPQHEFYRMPPELALPDSAHPPLIRLSAREASATAKICLAAAAFTKGLFREGRNP
jgi:serine kinase of HPr protein (carbohydrate metabolism regulator)